MTTSYAVSRNIGSVSYNNYVNAPITGPLSTNQTPCHIPYHNYGALTGIRPTPPFFYPMQEPVYSEMNSNMRKQYLRTAIGQSVKARQTALGKSSSSQLYVVNSSQRKVPVSGHCNYIPPIPSSMYVNIVKANAVGQSAYKVKLPNSAPISSKSYYPSGVRSTIKRVRSGGCTAPKKKGAIENIALSNGKTCAWGSLVRQNY